MNVRSPNRSAVTYPLEALTSPAWSCSSSIAVAIPLYTTLRTSHTIKQINTMVPISPYPNIVASTENTILGFSFPDIDLEH